MNHFIEFEEDSVTLESPMFNDKFKGGWKIYPLFPPTVSRNLCGVYCY